MLSNCARSCFISLLAADERQITVEFRLGDGSDAPAEQQLNAWLETGELVQAFCTGLAARPFVHREGKTYRTRGKEVQIGDAKAALDAFVVFAMSPLGDGALSIDEAVRKARAAYKRGQRAYRERRSAERLKQLEAEMPERIKQLQERKAAQEAEKQAQAAEEATGQNGRKR
ncbi:MAG TPA: hypothetical protein VGP82_06025 [Ktedonobacterales bacterium]|nr:hypothetical protein [Ktedonobacterales bacterium]